MRGAKLHDLYRQIADAEIELASLRRRLAELVGKCVHDWSPAEKTTDNFWTRTCNNCGHREGTHRTQRITTTKPLFD